MNFGTNLTTSAVYANRAMFEAMKSDQSYLLSQYQLSYLQAIKLIKLLQSNETVIDERDELIRALFNTKDCLKKLICKRQSDPFLLDQNSPLAPVEKDMLKALEMPRDWEKYGRSHEYVNKDDSFNY